jgi:glycosyltransferase involved in cell wall biosynthesis
MRNIFLLVPSLQPTGPGKGAFALANGLAGERHVNLVALKGGGGADAYIDPRVKVIAFGPRDSWASQLTRYRNLLHESGGRDRIASISFCFSADMINLASRRMAVVCASVRGNLPQNYRMDHGIAGLVMAKVHLASLRHFDRVAVMTRAMASQVSRHGVVGPHIIGNFVDEPSLEVYRQDSPHSGPLRAVFLASLSRRKCPLLLLKSLHDLRRGGVDMQLDIIGDGPLRRAFEDEVARLNLRAAVAMHGHLSDPYPILARADVMVLPSLSEGVSRAALEALYLGVPCVLRAVDGNQEVVQRGMNGGLFDRDAELAEVLLETAQWSRQRQGRRHVLLPGECRQRRASLGYLKMVEAVP